MQTSDGKLIPSRAEQEAFLNGESTPNPFLTPEQVTLRVEEFWQKIRRLQSAKARTLATPEDGLSNFRATEERLKSTLPQVFLTLMEQELLALESQAQRPGFALDDAENRLLKLSSLASLFYVALREETLKKRKGFWGF